MLLQQIVLELDGELLRLKSLRDIVAGLARSPSIVPILGFELNRLHEADAVAPAVTAQPIGPEVAALTTPVARLARGRGRPRKASAGANGRSAKDDAPTERSPRVYRTGRRAQPTALSKAAQVGPVVISAAALARERETRGAAKAASPQRRLPEMPPEVRPEAFARELAARWLSSPHKG